MAYEAPSGPSASAPWERIEGEADRGWPPVLALPDAANDAAHHGRWYCLPVAPALVRDSADDPVLSLSLFLERQPTPEETSIIPLVRSAALNFDLELALPPDLVQAWESDDGADYVPLFARNARFELIAERDDGDSTILASGEASGTTPRAALSARLERDDALLFLAALDGDAGPLSVCVSVTYHTVGGAATATLRGSWAAIHDGIARVVVDAQRISGAELRRAYDTLVSAGTLRVEPRTSAGALFDLFVRRSSVILQRTMADDEDGEPRWALRDRPHPMFTLDLRERMAASSEQTVDLRAALHEVIGGALDGRGRSAFIHLHHLQPNGNGAGSMVQRRARTTGSRSIRHGRTDDEPVRLAMRGDRVQSIKAALKPSDAAPLAIHASNLKSLEQLEEQMGWGEIVEFVPPKERILPLPVVDNSAALLWYSRDDASRYWYLPTWTLVMPERNVDPAASPFTFVFEQVGTNADGTPAINGTLRYTLRKGISDAVTNMVSALGNPTHSPVEPLNLAVYVDVPFINRADNTTMQHRFTATVEQNGDTLTASVALLNEWVNLAYGALSIEGFQRETVRVAVAYSYQGYVTVGVNEYQLAFGGKSALTPIMYTGRNEHEMLVQPDPPDVPVYTYPPDVPVQPYPPDVPVQPYFDAVEATYVQPTGDLHFKREARVNGRGSRNDKLNALAAIKATNIAARPLLIDTVAVPEIIRENTYALRWFSHEERHALFVPCREHGALYRQRTASGERAVGCRPAHELATATTYQEYSEIAELTHPLYRVFSSLQQPGRFLVLPSAYRITRKEPPGEDAYRPCSIVYAELSVEGADAARYLFEATLLPDLPPYVRRDLQRRLAAYAPSPIMEYPTEVARDVQYNWTVADIVKQHHAVMLPASSEAPGSFAVNLVTNIADGQLLMVMLQHSGVGLSVDWTLHDDTVFQSSLLLQLGNIAGPWRSGPIETTVAGDVATLRNRIDRAVSVSELVVYNGTVESVRIAVDADIAPDATHTATLGGATGDIVPVYTVNSGAPVTLDQIEIFEDEVQTNVIFVNQVNYANHGLERLDLEARIEGIAGTMPVQWRSDERADQPSHGEIEFTLPITAYLNRRILEYRVTKTFTAGGSSITPWISRDLFRDGNVVSLIWPLIEGNA